MNLRFAITTKKLSAAAVHLFTGSGAVLGLLSLLSSSDGNWTGAFAWLGTALIVDGADGPLARWLQVEKVLPRFSGKTLDNVVDYLNYVAVPAFIAARSAILPEGLRTPLAGAIMLVSLYHFADTESKTEDGYFVGFPAIWNVVLFYCFALAIPGVIAVFLIVLCGGLTFVPLRWVHPLRVRRLRTLTSIIVLAWAAASIDTLIEGFPAATFGQVIFVIAALYSIGAGVSGGWARASPPVQPRR